MSATARDTTEKIHAAIAEGDRPGVTEPKVTEAASPPRKGRKVKKITRRVLTERLGAEVVTYLDGLTLQQLLCLAYGHIWPVLVPGRGRPKGWRANLAPQMDGVFLITESCIRDEDDSGRTCGSDRTTYTGERGIFMERGRHRSYKRDKDIWQIRPEGSRISRIDVLDYIFYLMGAELFTDASEGDGGLA
jgi:hypothetical protein